MDSDDDEHQLEFELPLLVAPDLFAAHQKLADRLRCGDDTPLERLFLMLAALCDPLTQPEDSDDLPLSVDVLGDIAMALAYQMLLEERASGEVVLTTAPDVASLRFSISLKLFELIQSIHRVLRADDELRLRYLRTSRGNWTDTARYWLPEFGEEPDATDTPLKLLYYIACVAIMGLYKLFHTNGNYNAALNPYLEYLLRLWKTHTSIVALALEMDRELEEKAWEDQNEYLDTPEIVRCTLLGSSALRAVLAYVLEQTVGEPSDLLRHDITVEPLIDFYDPLTRSAKNCGSIVGDQSMLMITTLIVRLTVQFTPRAGDAMHAAHTDFPAFDEKDFLHRSVKRIIPFTFAGDLLVDLYYRDQFDEDIKYVFGYYDSDEESDDVASLASSDIPGMAKRLREDELEFDADGRDWRDCPRGLNVKFDPAFVDMEAKDVSSGDASSSNYFFASWSELHQALEFLALAKIEHVDTFIERVGQVIVNTIARAVRDELSAKTARISPDKIHRHLVLPALADFIAQIKDELLVATLLTPTNFELILRRNPQCALCIIDEMLMCKGLRRSLIWFLTHSVNPLMVLINYLYELVAGLRGNSSRQTKYHFSRQGALEISQVEELMILHELFAGAFKWFSGDDVNVIPALNAMRLVSYICLMIQRLLKDGIIKENSDDYFEDYSLDIQVLLFPWVGKVPEARDLFFKFKLDAFRRAVSDDEHSDEMDDTEPMSIEDALAQLKGLDADSHALKLQEPEIKLAFKYYGDRLVAHLFKHYGVKADTFVAPFIEHSSQDDFNTFLLNFNELSLNKEFFHDMFQELEEKVMGDRPVGNDADAKEDDAPMTDEWLAAIKARARELDSTEPADAEFSELFFNGEAEFQGKEKKKRNKKKKKRSKKR